MNPAVILVSLVTMWLYSLAILTPFFYLSSYIKGQVTCFVQLITHRIFNFIFKKFSIRKLEYTALLQAITTASS